MKLIKRKIFILEVPGCFVHNSQGLFVPYTFQKIGCIIFAIALKTERKDQDANERE